ncbi:hypothetical protein SHKM778_88690 [Streptomyces sp. KM77-8]|uniref:Uncharacterized protein n=1 Tax=Streptomyces haneummycinicus TaxID=3074435 RepID=A0AAT9HY27_9ACTN
MTVLASALNPADPEYRAHRDTMLAKLAALDAEHAKALAGGGDKYVERHRGAASSSRVSASSCFSTPTHPSWSCPRWPPGAATTPWAPRSSPASGSSRAWSA